jgi:GTP-binding protein YchF
MGLKCGIVGLPNVGKSTLFNALTRSAAQAANYPFCTIEPNSGQVPVPDKRLDFISECVKTQRVIPTTIEIVDIAGLVKGASKGEGLGNQFLGHIKQCDAVIHVVRCFDDSNIIHVEGTTDPARDIDTIQTELILADYETVGKSIDKHQKLLRSNIKGIPEIVEFATKLYKHLGELKTARSFPTPDSADVAAYCESLHLITAKPVLYAANVAEDDLTDMGAKSAHVQAVRNIAAKDGSEVIVVSAQIEHELSQLAADEARDYLAQLGVTESGLDRLVHAAYQLLGLMTYFTAGEKEVRAWTITSNTRAPQAAGVIHSDFEKGFICAEVYNYQDLVTHKKEAKVKEAGLYRKEGKEYVCSDGDIMHFLFNV